VHYWKSENRIFKAVRKKILDISISGSIPDFLELTIIVEWYAKKGFMGDAGVSYLFKTNKGSILFDVGFGPSRPAFCHNAAKLKFHMDKKGIDNEILNKKKLIIGIV